MAVSPSSCQIATEYSYALLCFGISQYYNVNYYTHTHTEVGLTRLYRGSDYKVYAVEV